MAEMRMHADGTPVPRTDLYHDSGFQLPVTAGHVFCTLTPPAGDYRVDIRRIAYGTGQPAVANNSYFFVGSDQNILSTGAVLGVEYVYQFFVKVDGQTAMGIAAVGNGSVNIGVSAGITATPLN